LKRIKHAGALDKHALKDDEMHAQGFVRKLVSHGGKTGPSGTGIGRTKHPDDNK
jgi:hypothetical protein